PAIPSLMLLAENCPVRLIAEQDSIKPISIEPESPMNILAGQKLCGRKPRQAPPRAAVSIAAVVKICCPLTKISSTEKEKNAIAPIPTTPAASPSRPSTKFTALTVVTMMITVSSAACEPPSVNIDTEPPPGSGSQSNCTP